MIISVSDARNFIKTDLTDEKLDIKLKALETLIRSYTHNNFQIREIRSQSEILNNRILNPPKFIAAGDTIQISQSLLNNGVYTVTEITEEGMTILGDLLDCTKNLVTKVYYPPDIVDGILKMLKWELNNIDKIGIQSEKISRHLVTYFNMDGDNSSMGYPRTILGFLKPYMKARL